MKICCLMEAPGSNRLGTGTGESGGKASSDEETKGLARNAKSDKRKPLLKAGRLLLLKID